MKIKIIMAGLAASVGIYAGSAHAQQEYLGEMFITAANFCPTGTFDADGRLLSISQYTALFSLLGTNFGGDGRTTFGLPDMRGRVPMHYGTGPSLSQRRIGDRGGNEETTILATQLPSHNHSLKEGEVITDTSDTDSGGMPTIPSGSLETGTTVEIHNRESYVTTVNDVVSATGTNQPVTNMMPSLGLRYCITWSGIFPSRSKIAPTGRPPIPQRVPTGAETTPVSKAQPPIGKPDSGRDGRKLTPR